ncbi:SigB/SigF/SigG family RNA polymerase sigma factor [Streptomyces sp. NBC_00083]|uniref:SigB/SigF/SigG family RNA polymerase sigma factor n=1 Tax=Streptomyces sp. NBC_00083 TaxID=2975647 RepID=UPI00224CD11C|nr:SigB/SigF/SigG family RNA polymerase sigma factor [Streptomyces sp. NBC_00083]MCX5384414.1 SigB/SigF/SigG family RNA polymerase sigma factor [Streptomyces sp. NBC_00083]
MSDTSHSRGQRGHDDVPGTAAAFVRLGALAQGPEYEALRDDLVARWLPMARRLALKYRNRGAEIDDLYQVAAMGLVKAVDRYEVAQGPFEAYAIPTINGEIKRHFRDALWAVHVPRRIQDIRNKVRLARQELKATRPGEPTVAELAALSGLDEQDVRDGLEALGSFKSLSLEAESRTEGGDAGETVSLTDTLGAPDPGFDAVIDREAVRPALRALPERESQILYMRFFGDMTQNQIAAALGISQMHVSRLLNSTCARLRDQALADPRVGAA